MYKRKTGARTYCDYTEETVERALRTRCSKIKGGLRAHDIPYGILCDKFHGKHTKKHGNNCGMLVFCAFDLIFFHHMSFKRKYKKIFSSYSFLSKLTNVFFSLYILCSRVFRKSYLLSNKKIPGYDIWESLSAYLNTQHYFDSHFNIIKSKYIETLNM